MNDLELFSYAIDSAVRNKRSSAFLCIIHRFRPTPVKNKHEFTSVLQLLHGYYFYLLDCGNNCHLFRYTKIVHVNNPSSCSRRVCSLNVNLSPYS